MVVSDKPDRLFWIDFNSAQTLPENKTLTPRQQNWMEGEIQRMDYFVNGPACSRILTNTVLTVHPRPKTMQKEN
jgi:hypothetical protein